MDQSTLDDKVFQVRQKLAKELQQLRGGWVLIDLDNERLLYHGNKPEVLQFVEQVYKQYASNQLYLELAGRPFVRRANQPTQ